MNNHATLPLTLARYSALLLVLPLLGIACKHTLPTPVFSMARIEGIPGPEDLIVDGGARLLVSSQERRVEGKPGQIYAVDLATGQVALLPRTGEPDGLSFHPHGIDRVVDEGGQPLLYAITHRREGDGARHAICVYEIHPDELVLRDVLEDPLLTSPNDLAARPDGTIYVNNDRANDRNWNEVIAGKKKATIVHYDGRQWSVVADKLGMGNGIAVDGRRLLAAATRENAIYRFDIEEDGTLTGKLLLASVAGPDNLSVHGSRLLVACHENTGAFIAHSRNPRRLSPTAVYSIELGSGAVEPVFLDDGSHISAAATAVLSEGVLYIGQVFEPFLLKVVPAGSNE